MPLSESSRKVVGILVKNSGLLWLQPCNKKGKPTYCKLNSADYNGAKEGDVVVAEKISSSDATEQVKVTKVLGQHLTPKILSLISLYEQGLSDVFSEAAKKEAQSMSVPDLQGREDLRNIPLVTIDGADSRDFDDAVFAEKTSDGGFHLVVAIADVSWYVRPGSELDKEAFKRGNSTYFPDMVVPMLPVELSNGLCSLNPHEDRAVMAMDMQIDKDGNMTSKKVVRGLMRSAARLTYEQVQAAKDGRPDTTTTSLMDTVINPLYAAYEALKAAREKRGAMDLGHPEYKFDVNDKGEAVKMAPEGHEESHKVIEEFMVLANVAAATLLEEKHAPCVYRVHDIPPYQDAKVDGAADGIADLRKYLSDFGLTLPPGKITSPLAFKDVVEKAKQLPNGDLAIYAILRHMSKAEYSTKNVGHFGLALEKYAHFTSPIRRYADLLVHRSLAEAFNLCAGAGALTADQKEHLDEMTQHINDTENLSKKAERSADDRFAADYLSSQIGKEFKGHITGVISAGVFVKLDGAGSEGLLLAHSLPHDYYTFDAKTRTLTGSHNGLVYKTGDKMTVRIKEANSLNGSVLLVPANDDKTATAPAPRQDDKNKNPQRPQKHWNHGPGHR